MVVDDFFKEDSSSGRFKSLALVKELGRFLWKKKLFWLVPIILMLVVAAGLILFSQSSVLSPFVYALF